MKEKIKYVIVDDEQSSIKAVRLECMDFDCLENVGEYINPKQFLKELSDINFDICFLDYNMPEITGVKIAKILRSKNKEVVFVTSEELPASIMFELDIIDYVKKPFDFARFSQAVDKIKKNISSNININKTENSTINFKIQNGILAPIELEQIRYISTKEVKDPRDKLIVLEDNSEHIVKDYNFKFFEDILPKNKFTKISSKTIIYNKTFYKLKENDYIELKVKRANGNTITCSIGKTYKDNFNKYILKQ